MPNQTELSETKRALLEKYLRGNRQQAASSSTRRVIPRRSDGGSAPLSFNQQQLWVIAQLIGDSPVYNECVTVHLPGPLDIPRLERSFNALIQRHEAWRTCFPVEDGQAVQQVQSELTFTLPVVDLRSLPHEEREAEALRRAKAEALPPFDLIHGPLLRATLMQLDDEDHRLFLTLHHIIFDGMTVYQVFLPELRAVYEAFSAGQSSPLPELPIQYTDFAVWQREQMQGQLLDKQLAYWKQQLAGVPALLELPADHPRPPVPSYRGAIRSLALGKPLTDALRAFSRKEGCTLYVLLQAALNTLLYRYTGQHDILVGTATSGRTQAEVQKLMGVFINMLVMRTNMEGSPSFRELLARVREATLEAQEHADVPFEYVVKELQPQREQGQNPFFQVLLMLEPAVASLPSGWTLTHMEINTDSSKFDLSLIFEDRPEGLIGWFEYSTDLFEASTIERMMGHWQTLLAAIIADPTQTIDELPILTDAERQQLLVEWNATQTAYPKDLGVHQLFEQQVERTPTAVALLFEEQQVTYSELNERANQLAHRLQQLGVGPEVCVGLCLKRSPEMVVGLLGILKAGGAYVPLDPAYPKERLAFMLADTQAPVLLTQEQYLDVLPVEGIHVLCLDTAWQSISKEPTDNLISKATGEHLAYIMYTSGSTGKPKGVEILHHNISRLVFGVDYARLDATRTLLHMATISFDASTFELWGALLHGARCVLFPEPVPTPKGIGEAVRKHKVTTVWLTASLFNALLDDAPEELRDIEQLLTGGEALSVVHIRRALERLPETQFINGYGPTESTTFACCYPIPQEISEQTRSIPIGRPIGNTQVYILDRHMNPVPIGVVGELYIGGDGLAKGYHNRPELTLEKFVAHPWSSDPNARLYKTGDLVRYLVDGSIEFLGRLDHQVKLRGFRIELGEIEAVFGQHAAVQEALVLARQDERGGGEKYLVAYIVPKQGQHFTLQDVRRFLKEHLPEYMIPSEYILLDAMPLTPNGKVDHRALPIPERDKRTVQDSYVAPVLTVHKQLVEIWQDILNVRPIGITDNFFALGGHSLLAARIVDRIQQTFGKKLPLTTFFSGATIERLAVAIQEEHQHTIARASVVTVQAGGARYPFFFLHGDWAGGGFYCRELSDHLGPDQPFYILEPYKFLDLPVPPTFEEMAAAHIEAMRAVQPEGPYLLGGFCNGGLMAYEMARQLKAQGQKVDLLALIDPAAPRQHKVVRDFIGRFSKVVHLSEEKQVNLFLRYIYLRIPAYRHKVQNGTPASLAEQLDPELKSKKKRALSAKVAAFFPKARALHSQWAGVYRWVVSSYMPGTYNDKITFLWSSAAYNENQQWHKLTGMTSSKTETHIFSGTHSSSKTINLPIIAEKLGQSLENLETRT